MRIENGLPQVSVIVPTYNYSTVIGQTLDSLLAQTYRDWECWVIDDGSTDNTREVVKRYCESDLRIRYCVQTNAGPTAARNNGIRRSTGKYIQFLDADDLLEPRKIELHVRYLDDYPEVDIVYGSARYFRSSDLSERRYSMQEKDEPWMPEISGSGPEFLKTLILRNIMVLSAPLIRRKVINKAGVFDSSLPILGDWDYWIRCAAVGMRFHYLDAEDTLSLIRWHTSSISSNEAKMQEERFRLRRKINKIIRDKDALNLNRALLTPLQVHNGIDEIKRGNLTRGVSWFLKAASDSEGMKSKFKWYYSAAVAPLAPRHQFEEVVYLPLRQSLTKVLRYRIGLNHY